MARNQKEFIYKIFTREQPLWDESRWDQDVWGLRTTSRLVGIWRNEVINDPAFRTTINGADGEMTLDLARPFDNYGEGVDIVLNNTVEVYVNDKEAKGKLLYRGYILSYTPMIEADREFLRLRIRGFGATLADRILKDSDGNTTISYSSQDPSDIFRDIINKFVTVDEGQLGYTALSVADTGTVVSYTFNTNTYREALDKVIQLAPIGWFWRVDPDGTLYFQEKDTQIQHQISTKKDVSYFAPENTLENTYNKVYFIGGDTGGGSNLFLTSEDAVSIEQYGQRTLKISDGRVTVQATGETLISRALEEKALPVRRTVTRIIDSNGTKNNGYDIESLRVGETILISELTGAVPDPTIWDDATWDSDVWDNLKQNDPRDIMQIVSLGYSPDEVEIEATSRLPEIAKRIEDINRNLEGRTFQTNPSAATEV